MRLLIVTAAFAALSLPAFAQQPLPPRQPQQQQQQPQRQQPQQQPQRQQPPPQQQAQPQQPEPPAAGMFACRTEPEICFIAIALGNDQISVLYSNDPKAEDLDATPIKVQTASGNAGEVNQHAGRVVMLVGQYDKATGVTLAQVIDVAGPLLSFSIKSQLSGGDDEEEPEPAPPPKPAPRQQQRR